ncbi:MAG: prolipoprotein diacylglyceryl transferase [Ruminococcaceae bacterium]|nr:prolipoprotein diacylglyceryl transferase [Oscillospiraceae bacterium]
MNDVIVSFPGFGIGEMTINKVAFSIGNMDVRWYGIIITLGIIAGVGYAMYRSKEEGLKYDDILDYALWVILCAIIGARLYYVLTTLKDASGHWNYHSFIDVIAVWEGGLAIYGGVIAGAAAIVVVSLVKKFKKNQVLKVFDVVSPGVMLGQLIGRWGNFFNGEAHGVETSERFFLRMGLRGYGADTPYPNRTIFYHPTFLYESLWNLLGFVLINLLYRKKKFDGQIMLMYLAWYGFGRMLIEGLRTDSLYIGVFRVSQVVGFLCFLICTILLVLFLVRAQRAKKDGETYDTVYDKLRGTSRRRAATEEESGEASLVDSVLAQERQTEPIDPNEDQVSVAEGGEKE